ncbi:uncharacterized protein LOC128033344 [Gossypium raimondii]|uniref:uncharacterized protein LOC128033344 n=1 Tax=Gossypium raimondii TaxID=29730 RepID=UPI00227C067C|nr:uncharacterized protein LOC128033344 [Gossypium raimondii]
MRPKKKVRSSGPVRVGAYVAPAGITLCVHYGRRHPGECWRTTEACLRYRSTKHRVRECPLRVDQVQAAGSAITQPLRVVQQSSKGRGQARGGNGTFLIFDVPYAALIDIGFTHSYVACSVSKNLGIPVESTSSELVKHRVSLDCATKRVVLRIEEGNEVVMIGERRNYLANVISTLVAEKLVYNGCEAYLAYVSVSTSGDSTVKDIRTVAYFLDIFPKDLPGLPPNRDVEFGIELVPGTAMVIISPYRMAPNELTELKAQI